MGNPIHSTYKKFLILILNSHVIQTPVHVRMHIMDWKISWNRCVNIKHESGNNNFGILLEWNHTEFHFENLERKNLYRCLKHARQSHQVRSLMGHTLTHEHDIYDKNWLLLVSAIYSKLANIILQDHKLTMVLVTDQNLPNHFLR